MNVPDITSGFFCVSMTAAMGMPKLDAGPQKSVVNGVSSYYIAALMCLI